MPALSLIPGTVRRSLGDLPQLPIKNLFAEKAITEPGEFRLLSRWPLFLRSVLGNDTIMGDGPVTALMIQDGVLNGTLLGISDGGFYTVETLRGAVPGTGPASLAGNEVGVIMTAGEDAKFYDGATFRAIAFPDGAYVTKVIEQGGRFVFLRKDTQKYYWTEPLSNMLDGSGDIVIAPLDFASAENEPDELVDAVVFKDHLVLGGKNTIELHGVTGDDNLPWAPTLGSTLHYGVYGTNCMALWNDGFAWVSRQGVVLHSAGGSAIRISDNGIEELILNSDPASFYVDSFFLESHEFLRIKGPLDGDLLLDAQTMQWTQFSTDDGPWLAGPVSSRNVAYSEFGSSVDGKVLLPLQVPLLTKVEEAAPDRIFRAGFSVDGGSVPVSNILLRCQVGEVEYPGGTIAMRYSRDAGRTWSNWISGSLGSAGEFRTKVEWRALGLFDQPGFLAEFKIEDAKVFSVSAAFFNEFLGGRGRG